jgi:hypothetical protein
MKVETAAYIITLAIAIIALALLTHGHLVLAAAVGAYCAHQLDIRVKKYRSNKEAAKRFKELKEQNDNK